MKIIVDNVGALGVEFCLLDNLTNAFTPEVVALLDDDVIKKIAAESEESMQERVRAEKKLRVLNNSFQTLSRFRRSKHNGLSFSANSPDEVLMSHLEPISILSQTVHVTHRDSGSEQMATTPDGQEGAENFTHLDSEGQSLDDVVTFGTSNGQLSPFDKSGNFRADDSWFSRVSSPPKKKKVRSHTVTLAD